MAYKLTSVDKIKIKVHINVPGDMGRSEKADFNVTYKKLPTSESKLLLNQVQNDEITDEEILVQNVLDIEGIKDENGGPVDFDAELVNALCEIEYVRRPLIEGFMTVQFGRGALGQKNS